MHHRLERFSLISILVVSTAMGGQPMPTRAAVLDLANAPIFLGNAVEPNVFVLRDDSGSMDWDLMTPQADGVMNMTSGTATWPAYYATPAPDHRYEVVAGIPYNAPSEETMASIMTDRPLLFPTDFGIWRARNAQYNKVYYDPTVRYQPWKGVNDLGMAFGPVPATAAPVDPYDTASPAVDLTAVVPDYTVAVPGADSSLYGVTQSDYYIPRYYLCQDSGGADIACPDAVPGSHAHRRIDIVPGNAPFTGGTYREDCAADDGDPTICSYLQEMQNFANWFTYYRRRDLAAKAAIGAVVADLDGLRAGYATLNQPAYNLGVAGMNAGTATGNKRALLDQIYGTARTTGGTPLLGAFERVGRYFECQSGDILGATAVSEPGDATCPVLEAPNGTCQQNYSVIVADGFYNDTISGIGNADADDAGNEFDGGAFADAYSNTLADIAMRYFKNDLHDVDNDGDPMENRVVMSDEEKALDPTDGNPLADREYIHQHLVTYSVGFGVDGTLSDEPSDPTATNWSPGWPDPAAGSAEKIDDLRHAAYNGRGGYFSASDPTVLLDALSNAFDTIIGRVGSSAAVAANSGSLRTGSRIFQARFDSTNWTGSLRSFRIDPKTGQLVTPAEWQAEGLLDARDPGNRVILSMGEDTSGDPIGVPFRWGNLTAAQQALLNQDSSGVADPAGVEEGEARLNYVRGDRSDESPSGNNYRKRDSVLGDLVDSAPIFVGDPPFDYTDGLEGGDPDVAGDRGKIYRYFKLDNVGRTPMVYIGGNAGMLHGINASFDADTNLPVPNVSGQEEVAYVPGVLMDKLTTLVDDPYTHEYFVNGSPAVGDAFFASPADENWHTVLVSGLRAGGQGFFALDVTAPDAFLESNASSLVLWEFTDANDPDLGYSFSHPAIARLNNGQWAALVGNGYNNTESDGRASTTGDAMLFILDIRDGSVIAKISTEVGAAEDPLGLNRPNGLASVSPIDIDDDTNIDYVYAGDLFGNVWKFDLTDTQISKWQVAYTSGSGGTTTPLPLYTACAVAEDPCQGQNIQPITVRPEIIQHPVSGWIVLFGTGKYLEQSDNRNTGETTQTFYGIWDTADAGTLPTTRGELLQQFIERELTNPENSAEALRITTDYAIMWWDGSSGHKGWYLDLVDTEGGNTDNEGERSVTGPIFRGGRIIFTTLLPAESCGEIPEGWLMELAAASGARLGDSPIDINNDGLIDVNDLIVDLDNIAKSISGKKVIDGGILTKPTIIETIGAEYKYLSTSTGAVSVTRESGGLANVGRMSWRERLLY